ncbi:MAG: TldD/PmbA family protein [Actinomycetota bacterium]|nr:TldD/PmbA family protein [Actinomycetota bacterium]
MIDEGVLKDALTAALTTGGEFAEVYAETRTSTSVRLEDRRVEEVTSGRDRGAGIRVIHGESTAYAYTNRLDRASIIDAAKAAAAALHDEPRAAVGDLRREPERVLNPVKLAPEDVAAADKIATVVRIDEAARARSGDIRQVIAAYVEGHQDVLIANSEGLCVTDDRTRTRVSCQVVAARDGVIQTGHFGPGASTGFELLEQFPPESVGQRAADQAIAMLSSSPAPAGEMPVVLAPGGGGVLFHEACGHGLEADLIHKDASVYKDRTGEKIASDLVTGIDDGSLASAWGSFAFDDEGTPSQRTVLFDKGVLTAYMTDLLRARTMGLSRSGNGRRQSYAFLPIPRMTNSFLVPGDADPEEILKGVKKGLYAKSFGGGEVNTATADFVFGLTEAYLIENGELTTPVRGANLIGNGPQILARIDAVGRDWESWTGVCGKDGQGVPVTSGMPTVRISKITVGGTSA